MFFWSRFSSGIRAPSAYPFGENVSNFFSSRFSSGIPAPLAILVRRKCHQLSQKFSLQDESFNFPSKKSVHRATSNIFSRPASHLGLLWRADALLPFSAFFAQPSPHLRCIFRVLTPRVTSNIFAHSVPSRFSLAALLDDFSAGSWIWGSWPAPKINDFQLKSF